MAGPIKPKPPVKRVAAKSGYKPPAAQVKAFGARQAAANRASDRVGRAPLPPKRGGGIDLNKFAGEVGANIGGLIGAAQQRVMGDSPISRAMHIPDSQNPLKRRP